MAADERWYFTKEQLQCTPSRKSGIDADKELSYRQQAANFIQDMGQRLPVNQLCINTAICYMHRFYMFHSFSKFHRNAIASCALFLAAKVEEQPRKLEHVIKVAHICLQIEGTLDTKSEAYLEQAQQLVMNENIMLQTLGFDVAIDHPHTHIVKCCQLVRASKDLAQTSYIMATNSLHLTTMCLQCKPTVVACVCIHLACKWASWEIPHSSEGKEWYWYVEKYITSEMLEELTTDFLAILEKCPSRLKKGLKRELDAVSEKKGRHDGASTSGSGVPHPMPSSPVPSNKQDKNDRYNRVVQDKMPRPDFNILPQLYERSQKANRQPDKTERHERKDKSEKEKRDRTCKQDKSHVKADKSDHRTEQATVCEKVHDFKEIKPEILLNASSNSNSQSSVGVPSTQRAGRSSGQASNVDIKPPLLPPPVPLLAAMDEVEPQTSVSKKRHGCPNINIREHKERREKERIGEKEPSQSASNLSILSKPSPLLQPGNQYERIRHRKEENQSLKLAADSLPTNNHTDVSHSSNHRQSAIPPTVAPVHLQDRVKENMTRPQNSHQMESKQSHLVDAKQRSKHVSPKIKEKLVSQMKPEFTPLNEEMLLQPPLVNEMRQPKIMKSELMGKGDQLSKHEQNLLLMGNHLPEFHEKPNKDLQAQQNKESKKTHDLSHVAAGLMLTHSLYGNQQMIVPGPAGDCRLPMVVPTEKHERHHERKEKHKHKSRDKEKKEKHEIAAHENQEMSKMPPPLDNAFLSQRIKLTISKDVLNSSHSEILDKKAGNSSKNPIKLKIPKDKLAPALLKNKEAGDILKLKIKIPKESMTVPVKKTESKKRTRSPKDPTMKSNSPRSPKVPRIETRSSRKDDIPVPHPLVTSLLPTPQTSGLCQAGSKANGNNAQFAGGAYSNYSRKGSMAKSDYKNKANIMPPYQHPMTAGPYAYNPYYSCRPPMPNFFPNAADYYYPQGYHQGPTIAASDHGVPPLPPDPPPPTPPPPPE